MGTWNGFECLDGYLFGSHCSRESMLVEVLSSSTIAGLFILTIAISVSFFVVRRVLYILNRLV